jgi:nitrogen fixation protein NifX
MKVAFATTDGINVDEHFGRCGRFVIYEMGAAGAWRVGERVFSEGRDKSVESTKGMGKEHDDAVEIKVDALSDCAIVYVTNIGGPSAARLSRRGIMPVKVKEAVGIEESVDKLMDMIKGNPPPWLRKLVTG